VSNSNTTNVHTYFKLTSEFISDVFNAVIAMVSNGRNDSLADFFPPLSGLFFATIYNNICMFDDFTTCCIWCFTVKAMLLSVKKFNSAKQFCLDTFLDNLGHVILAQCHAHVEIH
jgi:hypothetical protein